MILGLDVSTSCVGVAVIDENENIVVSEAIKLSSKDTLEYRAFQIQQRIADLADQHNIERVFVEAPLISSVNQKTVALLQRFHGMVSYGVFDLLGKEPALIGSSTARKLMGIKLPRTKGKDTKRIVIDFIEERYKNTKTPFLYERTIHQNPKPGTDDRADAIVVALAGLKTKKP